MKLSFFLIFHLFTSHDSLGVDMVCNSDPYSDFLHCVADSTVRNNENRQIEQEFYNDFVKLTGRCFDNSQSPDTSKCVLQQSDLNIDIYSDQGPLQDCGDRCIKTAIFLRDNFYKTDPPTKKCFRNKLSAAVMDDILPCVQSELWDFSFQLSPLPDFDENINDISDIVDKNINVRVMAFNRLDVCKLRNPQRAQITSDCMEKGVPGMYKKYCKILQTCQNNTVSANCTEKFQKVENAVCKCLSMKQKEWHSKIEAIQNALTGSGSSYCAGKIRQVVGTWPRKLQDAVRYCVPSGQISKLNFDKLIELGCIQTEGTNSDNVRKFQIGFRFVRNFLDAVNERMTRFCIKLC